MSHYIAPKRKIYGGRDGVYVRKLQINYLFSMICGGEGGIRTHGRRKPTPVFETGAIDHSATSPRFGGRLGRGFSGGVGRLQARK